MNLYFTFDDGPHRWTPDVLDALAEHGNTGTFFVLGCYMLAAEEVVLDAYERGHTIGVHGWDHTPWTKLSDIELEAGIGSTARLIADVTGEYPALYRPPHHMGGAREDGIAHAQGLKRRVGPGCDPGDWMLDRDADFLVKYVRDRAPHGSIVNWHDGMPPDGGAGSTTRRPTVEAVRALLRDGYTSTKLDA